jgi:hypothetical protein
MIEWIMLEWIHKKICKAYINKIRSFIDTSLELGYGNEQWFLNFLDELNKESVRV